MAVLLVLSRNVLIFNFVPVLFCGILFGMAINCYALAWTTIFSDSKLSSQIGALAIILPMAVVMALYQNHVQAIQYFYWLPHFPMILILGRYFNPCPYFYYMDEVSIGLAWAFLVINIPLYFFLYMYLDQIIPNTYGIAKSCCFCLRKKPKPEEVRESLRFSKKRVKAENMSSVNDDDEALYHSNVSILF